MRSTETRDSRDTRNVNINIRAKRVQRDLAG